MNVKERIKAVKAMEFLARQINDEDVFCSWLSLGVADGDIQYGDLSECEGDADLDCYIRDQDFANLMWLFLRKMSQAYKSGGLYCDRVLSQEA